MISGLVFTILILPFLQLGFSYYLSLQTVAFIAIFFVSRHNLLFILSSNIKIRVFASAAMLASVVLYGSFQDTSIGMDVFFRSAREIFCFFIITSLPYWYVNIDSRNYYTIRNAILFISVSFLILVVVQTIMLTRGVYFGIPQEFFVINQDTLPGELDLIYSDIRPMGTFGEPSYLAAVCFALNFGMRKMWSVDKAARFVMICLLVTSLFSRSLSGIFANVALIGLVVSNSRYVMVIGITAAYALLTVVVLALSLDLEFLSRFGDVISGNDVSFNVRVTEPIMAIPDMLANYPWGIPQVILKDYEFLRAPNIETKLLVQNGILNIIINYGYFGFIGLFVLLFSFKDPVNRFFILVIMLQNGSPLAIDKVAIIAVAQILSNSLRSGFENPSIGLISHQTSPDELK